MRRRAALALAVLPLAGCSGEQGERAQQLLNRAQVAQAQLSSASYEARMTFLMDGRRFSLVMDGGGYFKGRRAGDHLLTMRTDGVPGAGAFNMQLLVRRGEASMSLNGRRLSVPMSASTGQQYDWSATMLDLARYVKNVRVLEGRVANGLRGSTIAGVIDTESMVKTVSKLDTVAEAASVGKFVDNLGDIRAAVFVAERTGLIRSAVITMSMEAEGKKADIELTYRLNSTNKAVAGL
jgi:hypothetical protein